MKSFKIKGKETEELKQLYNNLQQYWDTLIQSKHPRKFSSPLYSDTIKTIELQDNSPRYLMSMLQQDQEPCMTRTNDDAAQEILQDRLEAVKSGGFKGRRLFDSDVSPHCEEVRSVSSFYSYDDEYESSGSKEQEEHHCTSECRYSSSSSCDLLDASVVKDMMAKAVEEMDNVATIVAETRVVGIRRYAVLFGLLAFVFLLISICMSGGCCDDHDVLVPT
ncbi:hypothetical protein TanjilG_27510 [Lupinus angustifolius]|uniref:Uncharacterized protein n=1 Tax=Lupinus angustifolius TaxID=3871 RepID=A0A4P1R2Z4_LUPAN|nr:hypothetical protein TanjilG_27510 [Lupinus angustifolius]